MGLNETIRSLQNWAVSEALPFWSEHGPDHRYGGFIEELAFDGSDAACEFKRTRVTCRQVYVFAHATLLGWQDGSELVNRGADYLIEKAWQGDDVGFARRLQRNGKVLDPTPDLYDHAFALFAFAWAHKATRDPAYADWAARTLEVIEFRLRHSSNKGFWHEAPPIGYRLQNPHMHLLEACLAAFDSTRDTRYQEVAMEISGLFKSHFIDKESGTLAEQFLDDWRIARHEGTWLVEPGHQFEWIWILENCRQAFGLSFREEIEGLLKFSETYGLNEADGSVMNAVRVNGDPIDTASRTWPNTERLKAAVAIMPYNPDLAAEMISGSGELLLRRYLKSNGQICVPRGAWIDSFDEEGRPLSRSIPASTLYHLFMAIAELDGLQVAEAAGMANEKREPKSLPFYQ